MPDDVLAGRREKKKKNGFKCLHDARVSHFEDLVGHKFVVHGEPDDHTQRSAVLVLKEAKPHLHLSPGDRPPHVRQEPFLLMFAARTEQRLQSSGIFLIEHRGLGQFELFLHETRVEDDPHWKHYEAVFN
jgi:hypothetical protein